jgi:hypothetical protein
MFPSDRVEVDDDIVGLGIGLMGHQHDPDGAWFEGWLRLTKPGPYPESLLSCEASTARYESKRTTIPQFHDMVGVIGV